MIEHVTAVVCTHAHHIEGGLLIAERLSEKLNDPNTDFIELHDARITSLLQDVDSAGSMWPIATIPKASILLATLDTQDHESPETRLYKFESKKKSYFGAIVGPFEVYGTGHLQFVDTPTRVLTDQLQSYFPVTNATILLGQRQGDNRVSTGLAFVNRNMVQALTLTQDAGGFVATNNPSVSTNVGASASGSGRSQSLTG